MKQYCKGKQPVFIELIKNSEQCSLLKKKTYQLDEVVPSGLCPYLYQIILPYYYTLHGGGCFRWMINKNEVEIQCPNTEDAVVLNIKKEGDAVQLKVIDTAGQCANGHFVGQHFNLIHPELTFCPRAFSTLFPTINRLRFISDKKESIIATCPNINEPSVFRLYTGE